jgi:hypothetical protein
MANLIIAIFWGEGKSKENLEIGPRKKGPPGENEEKGEKWGKEERRKIALALQLRLFAWAFSLDLVALNLDLSP